MSNADAVAEIARESPEAAGLVHQIVTASMNATYGTMDRLYENEREHRMALEVLIGDVIDALGHAHMGSAREYERAVAPLRRGVHAHPGLMATLAARHPDHDPA